MINDDKLEEIRMNLAVMAMLDAAVLDALVNMFPSIDIEALITLVLRLREILFINNYGC